MEKKNIDWSSIGFAYMPTDYRYVSNFKDGKCDEGMHTLRQSAEKLVLEGVTSFQEMLKTTYFQSKILCRQTLSCKSQNTYETNNHCFHLNCF